LYVLRNFWHREGVHKVVCSRRDISTVLGRLNNMQKRATSQLGFYEVIAAKGVHSVPAERARLNAVIGDIRIDRGRHFVDVPFSELERRLLKIGEGQTHAESPQPSERPRGQMRAPGPSSAHAATKSLTGALRRKPKLVETATDLFGSVSGDSPLDETPKAATDPGWQAWTVRCDACKALVPYIARMDEQMDVPCQDCSYTMRMRPGKHAL